jgi:hypothetical protein
MTGDFGDGKFFGEAGGKREVGGDDKLTFFLWGHVLYVMSKIKSFREKLFFSHLFDDKGFCHFCPKIVFCSKSEK